MLTVFVSGIGTLSILQFAPLLLRTHRLQPCLSVICYTDYYTGRRIYVWHHQEKETFINHVWVIGSTLSLYICPYPVRDFCSVDRQLGIIYYPGNGDVFLKENRLVQ